MSEAKFFEPEMPEAERTPLGQALMDTVGQQQGHLHRQATRIEPWEDELRCLKGGSNRPQLKPSQRAGGDQTAPGQEPEEPEGEGKKRRGKPARRQTEAVARHETQRLEVEPVPAGSQFKGYRRVVVQDLKREAHNTCFWLAQWPTPSGGDVSAELPPEGAILARRGPALCWTHTPPSPVTPPRRLERLREGGGAIATGPLKRLRGADRAAFHPEKAALEAAGWAVSASVPTDDTGARHRGRSGDCTELGNATVAGFERTQRTSRINCLACLQPQRRYGLDAAVLADLAERGRAPDHRRVREAFGERACTRAVDGQVCLAARGVLGQRAVARVTEGAVRGGRVAPGMSRERGMVSAGARQLRILVQGWWWVQAERACAQWMPWNATERRAIAWGRAPMGGLYPAPNAYPLEPSAAHRACIEALCATETVCVTLHQARSRCYEDKADPVRVLERPAVPVHNHLSESDRRADVEQRTIRGTPRRDAGRRCRDTFASLEKTGRNQGLSFWQCLKDRLCGTGLIPPLADLIRQAANA